MNKINKKHFTVFLSVIILLITNYSIAQTKSTNIKTINGKKYYIHLVEKGQSLYGISKLYGTDVNSVVVENHDAIDGIKVGQELNIPFDTSIKSVALTIDTNKYMYHKNSHM